jgi:hypothetical protein
MQLVLDPTMGSARCAAVAWREGEQEIAHLGRLRTGTERVSARQGLSRGSVGWPDLPLEWAGAGIVKMSRLQNVAMALLPESHRAGRL